MPAAILDTPYGFQENADELSARTVEFFGTSVGRPAAVASYRSRDVDALALATALARIREARYVMAGPGSPSYALRQWAGGPIPDALAAKLADGGILTMASAAALTVGVVTIPVYEIYKVGEEPRWLEGLDLAGPGDRPAGGRGPPLRQRRGRHPRHPLLLHGRAAPADPRGGPARRAPSSSASTATRRSCSTSRRGTAAVSGLGGVTVRVGGRSAVFGSGSEVPIEALGEAARGLAAGQVVDVDREFGAGRAGATGGRSAPAALPLRDTMAGLEGAFREALDRGDTRAAVGALLDLDSAISARVRAGEDSPDLDNADATFRSLIARLGERAEAGTRDPREALEPFVAALLELRARARAARDWATADLVRDRLATAGVEVRDAPDGSTWVLAGSPEG